MDKRRERNLNDPRRAELKEILDEKGKWWGVAAMMDGSIGYHTPRSAEIRIDQLIKGEVVAGCERCYAVFGNDSISEIEHDFRRFQRVEEDDVDKVKGLIEFAKKASQLNDETQMSISMLYPTHVR